jgi:exonuclease III
MRFGTWNVRSLYRAGSLLTVSRELARYKLDLVGVQEVRWEGGGTEPAGEYKFFYRKGNENHELGTVFFLCIRESYQQLGELSLLVIGCHT